MYKFLMPKFGMTMQTGFVVKWHKKEGEKVLQNELLLEVESEKINKEVESPVEGFIKKIFAVEGEEYNVGVIIALIAETAKEMAEEVSFDLPDSRPSEVSAPSAQKSRGEDKGVIKNTAAGNITASPVAKRLARERGVDLSKLRGNGPGGRIVEKDVLDYIESACNAGQEQFIEYTEQSLSPTRMSIAKTLSAGYHSGVFVTQMTLATCESLFKVKEENNVSVSAILVKMVAGILVEMPVFNAHFDGQRVKIYSDANIGIAVGTERGLIVSVVKKANIKDLKTINKEIKLLAEAARNKTITHDQTAGSTFTISNVGISRTDAFTPVLHFPEVAILGVGRIHKGVDVDENDNIKVVRRFWLSLTYDHRVIDGILSARFLERLCEKLES